MDVTLMKHPRGVRHIHICIRLAQLAYDLDATSDRRNHKLFQPYVINPRFGCQAVTLRIAFLQNLFTLAIINLFNFLFW